ncbi:hypothetical protein [Jatrophihabitans endophyticus]|uniref:hypothetical protein n=1 Tax=Jatrophihabitans endophyticus TaxID=1206085 RepID=UPI0009332818|nr:hypothetical protein [Jatrophihabitans endophyticus]
MCEIQDGQRRTDGVGRLGLHDHVIIRTRYALDEKQIRRLVIQAGDGHSVSMDDMEPGSRREASYVSKYVIKSADARWQVPWRADVVDIESGGEVTRELVKARYRTWSALRNWGLTMAQLRAEAAVWAVAQPAQHDASNDRAVVVELEAFGTAVLINADESPPLPS